MPGEADWCLVPGYRCLVLTLCVRIVPMLLQPRWGLPPLVKPCGVVIPSFNKMTSDKSDWIAFLLLCQLLLHGRSCRRMKSSFVCKIPSPPRPVITNRPITWNKKNQSTGSTQRRAISSQFFLPCSAFTKEPTFEIEFRIKRAPKRWHLLPIGKYFYLWLLLLNSWVIYLFIYFLSAKHLFSLRELNHTEDVETLL